MFAGRSSVTTRADLDSLPSYVPGRTVPGAVKVEATAKLVLAAAANTGTRLRARRRRHAHPTLD